MNQKKYSLLYPDINARYRTLSDVTMHDLGMDQALAKSCQQRSGMQNYIQNVMALYVCRSGGDHSTVVIFRGCPSTEKMRDDLMEILGRISFLKDYGSFNREYDESAGI